MTFSKEDLRKYLLYIFGVTGVVFFWAGIWDGVGNISYLANPLVSLVVGITLMTIGGIIFKDTSPFWTKGDKREGLLKKIRHHQKKHEFEVRYHDRSLGKEIAFLGKHLSDVEKGFVVLLRGSEEIFVPLERVTEIKHKGETRWKKESNHNGKKKDGKK